MNIFVVTLATVLAVSSAAPRGRTWNALAPVETGPSFSLSDSISKFNSKFYSKISDSVDGNIFYSPFSIHMILSQLFLGSPKNSTTRTELASLLHLDANDDVVYLKSYRAARLNQTEQLSNQNKGSIVRIGNKLYSNKDFEVKLRFREKMKRYFLSEAEEIDVERPQEASQSINNFVSNQTNGLIKSIVEPEDISMETLLVLVNAIYFKGSWKNPFDKALTRNSTFHVDETRQTRFESMSMTAELKTYHSDDLMSSVLELPYQNEKISMVVILPDTSTGLLKVEKKLEIIGLQSVLENLTSVPATPDLEVELPKFETSFSLENADSIMNRLGAGTIFGQSADLSEISDGNLHVSKMAHKAVVKVSEEGSEAAAVTAVMVAIKAFFEPERFIVNRPFLFYIVDVINKLPLFVGRIVDPNGKMKLARASGNDIRLSPAANNVRPPTNSPRQISAKSALDEFDQSLSLDEHEDMDPIVLPSAGEDTETIKIHRAEQAEAASERLAAFNSMMRN